MRLAIFDVDGTVLRGNSWQEYFWWTVREGRAAAPGLLGRLVLRKAGLLSARALREAALRPLRGLKEDEVAAVGRRLFDERLRKQVRGAARAEVERVRKDGFVPVLATGAFEFLAECVAEELGVTEIVCTRLEYEGGRCAGRIHGAETRREAKAAAVQDKFAGRAVDWAGSRAYSDDAEDAPLWALVGDRVMIRPMGGRGRSQPDGVRVLEWSDR